MRWEDDPRYHRLTRLIEQSYDHLERTRALTLMAAETLRAVARDYERRPSRSREPQVLRAWAEQVSQHANDLGER